LRKERIELEGGRGNGSFPAEEGSEERRVFGVGPRSCGAKE